MVQSLVVDDGPILAAAGGRVRSGTECVTNPFNGPAPSPAAIDADDVEPGRAGGIPGPGCEEHLGCPDQPGLFLPIDSYGGARNSTARAITDLHEHEAAVVQHHKIDFAVPAAVVAFDRFQPPAMQVVVRELLGGNAYSSRVSSYHVSPSSESSGFTAPSSPIERNELPVPSGGGSGTGWPPRNSAHARRRWMRPLPSR